jgi:glycosyltransferase involved in cell wall biosynthesis
MDGKSKILIVTQKVDIDDDLLGFMHGWISEFAKQCEQVTVVCLYMGKYDFPGNVRVLSLGKEKINNITHNTQHITQRIKYFYKFYKYIWQERKNYDSVFVHMIEIYTILGGWLWKLLKKPVGFWYAHGHISLKLKIAEKFCDIIFTSTPSGCRIKSRKIKVVGQGIDINKFLISNFPPFGDKQFQNNNEVFKIITIGRISLSKNYETLINAIDIVGRENLGKKIRVDIIGGVIYPEEKEYLASLQTMISEMKLDNIFNFAGPVANRDIIFCLQNADLFVNMGLTGSLDKAILEAMACGLPILTCNEALLAVLDEYIEKLMYKKYDYKDLAEKIKYIILLNDNDRKKISDDLRAIVVNDHSLEKLIAKILSGYF